MAPQPRLPLFSLLLAVVTSPLTLAAPTGTASAPAPSSLLGFNPSNVVINENTDDIPFSLVPGQTDAAAIGAYLNFNNVQNPQPIRGSKGGTDPGPRTEQYDILNPDTLAPPGTDHGDVVQATWPLGLSHMKEGLNRAGWSRQQNIENLPAATDMAGVDMRLEEGAYRELHWHKANEWAIVMNGSVRVEAVNEDGQTFVDDLSAGDVWFFPSGIPHSLQGLKGGVEFMLVFDDGSFSEDNTFLATETFAFNPQEILSKNFGGLPLSAWKNIPPSQLFIFPGTPAPTNISEQNITGSAGIVPLQSSYTYHLSRKEPDHVTAGGSVKIVDPTIFPIASMFSAAVVTVKPGALREIHWHTTSDEWNFFLAGTARIGIYAAQANSRTYDYSAGSVGYIPKSMTHYVENVGTEDVIFVEVLQADHFSDMSLGQWLGLTPPQIVMDTLNLTNSTVSQFPTEKQYVVPGAVVT